jgi:hypothetical protein
MNTFFLTISRASLSDISQIESIDDPQNQISAEGVETIGSNQVFNATISAGKNWMDCLNSYPDLKPLVISKRVADGITRAGFKGVRLVPLRMSTVKISRRIPFPYFALLPTGRALQYRLRFFVRRSSRVHDLVWEAPEGEKPSVKFDYWVRVPDRESWDGSDFMPFHPRLYIGPAGLTVCTRKVVELIRSEGWSNFSANPIDVPDYETRELRSASWPPETWYQEGYPPIDGTASVRRDGQIKEE